MIERMKKVTVLCESGKKSQLIVLLRDYGIVHIDNIQQKSAAVEKLEKAQGLEQKALGAIEGFFSKKNPAPQIPLQGEDLDKVVQGILCAQEEEGRLNEKLRMLRSERDRLLPFGDFDPKEVKELAEMGYVLTFWRMDKKELKKLSESDAGYIRIKTSEKADAIVLLDARLPEGINGSEFILPEKSLSEVEAEILASEKRIGEIKDTFRASVAYMDAIKARMKEQDEEILFEQVTATAESMDGVAYISGYIPEADAPSFKEFCSENKLAYLMDDPTEEENPPTKLKHKGFVRIIQPLFDMLGLVPGYREMDISLWFLGFMTLFFAMIIGDGGYGLLFVLLAAALNIKTKKCSDMTALIYVFGGATMIWGAVTGTWFGSETIIEKVGFLNALVIPGLTNFPSVFFMDALEVQNNMMSLCFSIGAIHLSIACLLCILKKLPEKNLSFLADLGWLINTDLLYLVVLSLVLGVEIPFGTVAGGIVVGFLLVCCFAEMAPGKPFVKGLTQSLGGFFTTFINTISCFSNVMSYIRLFAVGMASLAIAQSFNGMAAGMLHGFTIPAGVLILVLGHAINLVMGLLSIIVHGVRLNIMEFSGQVGVEWSGYKYEPFKRKAVK